MQNLLFLLLFSPVFLQAQEPTNRLITWEYERVGSGLVPIESAYVLYAYAKTDVGYQKEELMRTKYYAPHYSDCKAQIVHSRYLINEWGDIIDLETKKVLHDHINGDQLEGVFGDTVLFNHIPRQDDFRSKHWGDSLRHKAIQSRYYCYDLKAHALKELPYPGKIESPTMVLNDWFPAAGVMSPNGKYKATFVEDENKKFKLDSTRTLCAWTRTFPTYGFIVVQDITNGKELFRCPVLYDFSLRVGIDIPVYWIDNSTLLTHEENGKVIRISLNDLSVTSFQPLKNIVQCNYVPFFASDASGNVFYHCTTDANDRFRVDGATKTLIPDQVTDLSNGFQLQRESYHHEAIYRSNYVFQGQPILGDTTQTIKCSVAQRQLAVVNREIIPSRNQYDHWNTIVIYDADKKTTESIRVEYLQRMIGWQKP